MPSLSPPMKRTFITTNHFECIPKHIFSTFMSVLYSLKLFQPVCAHNPKGPARRWRASRPDRADRRDRRFKSVSSIRAVRIGAPPALARLAAKNPRKHQGFRGFCFVFSLRWPISWPISEPAWTFWGSATAESQNSVRNRSRFPLPIAEKRQGAFSYCRKFYPNRPLSKFYFENDRLLAHKSALYVKPRLVPAPYRPFIASQYGDVPDDPMEVRLFRGVLHG